MNVDCLGVAIAWTVWALMGMVWMARRDTATINAANVTWRRAAVVLIMGGPVVWGLILIGFTSAIWAGLRGRIRKGTEV